MRIFKISDDVTLKGELKDISIQNAFLAPEAIIVDLALSGRLNINVNGLN